MKILLSLFSFIFYSISLVDGNIQCRDENNNPVDWYVLYKFPKVIFTSDSLLSQGKKHMYITSSTLNDSWKISTNPIDSNNTFLTQTLSFIRENDTNVLWFAYNDQGDEISVDRGHSKGIVAGDKNGGLWLVHSIPHFMGTAYPKNGLIFGQSALCISFPPAMLNSVGDLLAYNSPKFQKWNIVNEVKDLYPKLISAFNGVKIQTPWTLEKLLISSNSTQFHSFAKAKEFDKDLYEWVASTFKTDLLSETWINGPHVLPSSCSLKYRVFNVKKMFIPKLSISYSSHRDHSKLAISKNSSLPWICVGDINRAMSQEKRGGGTVCLNNTMLWKSYSGLVKKFEDCTSETYPEVLLNLETHS